MAQWRHGNLFAVVMGATAALLPYAGQALEGKQCLAAWNLSAFYLGPNKDRLSQPFKDSITAAFFVLKDGKPVKLTNGNKEMLPCTKDLLKEIVVEDMFDLSVWEIIEEGGEKNHLPFYKSFKVVPAKTAKQNVLDRLSVRTKPVATP